MNTNDLTTQTPPFKAQRSHSFEKPSSLNPLQQTSGFISICSRKTILSVRTQYLKPMNSSQKALSFKKLYLDTISRPNSGGKHSKSSCGLTKEPLKQTSPNIQSFFQHLHILMLSAIFSKDSVSNYSRHSVLLDWLIEKT